MARPLQGSGCEFKGRRTAPEGCRLQGLHLVRGKPEALRQAVNRGRNVCKDRRFRRRGASERLTPGTRRGRVGDIRRLGSVRPERIEGDEPHAGAGANPDPGADTIASRRRRDRHSARHNDLHGQPCNGGRKHETAISLASAHRHETSRPPKDGQGTTTSARQLVRRRNHRADAALKSAIRCLMPGRATERARAAMSASRVSGRVTSANAAVTVGLRVV